MGVRPGSARQRRFRVAGGLGATWLVDPVTSSTVIVLTQRMFETSNAPRVHQDIQAAAYVGLS